LDATAANTLAGSVTVAGAELRLRGASGTMASVTSLTVNQKAARSRWTTVQRQRDQPGEQCRDGQP
jgi:hypothetical protein